MYKIDEIDKRILYELNKNSRIQEVKLGKLLNKSKEAIRYRVKKLIDEKIIQTYSSWIDPTKLGFQVAKLYFNLSNIPPKKIELLNYLKKDKRTFWVGVADGEWNIGATFFVKNNKEFFDLKSEIFEIFGDLILECKTGNVVEILYKPMTFLYNEKINYNLFFDENKNLNLDEIEIYILREFFKNSRVNIATIAGKYNITVDKIRSRIKRLEREKIIVRNLAVINYEKLDFELYKSFIYTKNLSKKELEKLIKYCEAHSNILHIVKQISEWDLELEIFCKGYKEYNKIISGLTEKFSNIIKKVETAIQGEDYIFPARNFVFE